MLKPLALSQVQDILYLAGRNTLYSRNQEHDEMRLILKALLLSLADSDRETILSIMADLEFK